MNDQLDKLDFGVTDIDSHTTEYEVIHPSSADKEESQRYDHIQDPQEKRKQVIYDIKTKKLDASDYPVIFKKFSEIIDKTNDGKFLYLNPKTTYDLAMRTKLIKFISTGKIGDALVSSAMGEIKKISKEIALEILRYIPLSDSHPTRKLNSLRKNGTLQDIIDFNLKKKHYDIFDPSWYQDNINPEVMRLVMNYRKTDQQELRGQFKESLILFKERLKQIYY